MTFTPDGKQLVVAGAGGLVEGWNVETGRPVELKRGPVCQITSLVATADGRIVVCGGRWQTVVVWEAVSGKVATPMIGHLAAVNELVFTAFLASMGPRRCGRGRGPSRWDSEATLYSFNGATTLWSWKRGTVGSAV